MKKNLKLILITVLLLSFSHSFSQVIKFKSSSIAFKTMDIENNWKEWTEPEETEVLIVFDPDNDRLKIFSKETQIYDITEYEGSETDKDGDVWLSFFCIDNDGLNCRLKFLTLNSQNKRKQLYVNYNNYRYVYNIYNLD